MGVDEKRRIGFHRAAICELQEQHSRGIGTSGNMDMNFFALTLHRLNGRAHREGSVYIPSFRGKKNRNVFARGLGDQLFTEVLRPINGDFSDAEYIELQGLPLSSVAFPILTHRVNPVKAPVAPPS